MGFGTKAKGFYSHAFGYKSTANGDYSTAMGNRTLASGLLSTAVGDRTYARGYATTVVGMNNHPILAADESQTFSPTTPMFIVGNGDNPANPRNAMAVLKNGNIGIGTNAPSAITHISGNSPGSSLPHLLLEQSTDVFTRLSFKNSSTANMWTIGGLPATTNSAAKCTFYYEGLGLDVMALQGDGKVGIGTSSPQGLGLHIKSSSTASGENMLVLERTAEAFNTSILYKGLYNGVPSSWATRLTLGSFQIRNLANNKGLQIQENGDLIVSGTVTANGVLLTSDRSFKTDIKPLGSALASLQSLNSYRYYWKDKSRGTKQQIGLIAQEIQQVYPELVNEDKEGNLSVNYIGLIPVLLEAIKEQQQQIKKLEAKSTDRGELEKRLAAIELLLQKDKTVKAN
jgi:hypothetical protein